jgi:hypothetical protein
VKRKIFLALILAIAPLQADEPIAPASPQSHVTTPTTDPAQVSAYYHTVLTRSEFQDTGTTPINNRLQDYLSQWFKSLGMHFGEFKYASRMPAFESLLMTLLVVFSIAVLLYIMMRLTRRDGGRFDEEEPEVPAHKIFRPPEFYDEEIRQAVQAADWHAAWLAAWRQFLSRLEHRHLVDADRTRTNREYLAQLRGQSLPGTALVLVTGMVDAYDGFIYGRKAIGESEWNLFHEKIDEATLLLNLDARKSGTETRAAI